MVAHSYGSNLLNSSLVLSLVRREVAGRYRGSALGIAWSLLTPLLMLGVYTFVFGTVFRARWPRLAGADGAVDAPHSTLEFAIILFAGLIVFQIFGEVVNRAPTLILFNATYVKKIVFPLEILPLVAMGTALFHAGVSLTILLVLQATLLGGIPATVLWLPVVVAPFVLLTLGLAWLLAAIGTYLRDIGQFLGTVVTALMFLSPIFFPLSVLPDWLRSWLLLNPIVVPVEQTRNVLIFGFPPDFSSLALYSLVAMLVAGLGYAFFQKTRRGFADVL